jgi:hypothetical protein
MVTTDSAQSSKQNTDTETYSKGILGPVYFTLSNLNVAGSDVAPADLHQSQYIVASNENFTISVDIEFNASPLAKLLMCLGTTISVDFGFEGFGAAPEAERYIDLHYLQDTDSNGSQANCWTL